jgi:RNA polymerase sigma-70 factor (ECF subfamily)
MSERDEAFFLARLKSGDEAAFRELVEAHHSALLRLARTFLKEAASAEEIVQETWLAVLEGLDGFEGRSALKSWIFSILANKARTRAVRDGRMVLFSDMASGEGDDEPAVDPSRFKASGYWNEPPRPWDDHTPERLAANAELMVHLREAIEALPEAQRAVVVLRDVEGCSAEEVCNILAVSETNQRVLLHRGRSRLRRALQGVLSAAGKKDSP